MNEPTGNIIRLRGNEPFVVLDKSRGVNPTNAF